MTEKYGPESMWNKKFTLLLIPGARGIMKQLSIPAVLVFSISAAILVLLVATVLLSTQVVNHRLADDELERLRAENEILKQKFEEVRWTLAGVEDRYDLLVEKEKQIRNYFDLPEINVQERQLGIGGPIPVAVTEMSPARLQAHSTNLELDRLLRLSEYELEKFGEVETALVDLKDRLRHTPSIWPTKGWLTTGYQMRNDPFTGIRRMHAAIDISNRRGTPIIAPADGKVVEVRRVGGFGNILSIDHGYGFKTRYAHLQKSLVKVGQRVKRGEQVALMGSTGHSTGPHLHYEVIRNGKKLNPRNYILNEK